ncbi:unnamed protein product [Trichobilharzia regenti]|nr:unnamed protein product [Trichobilharzia regenti]
MRFIIPRVRLWRDYNRAILLLYERCLRNSSEINDEILNFERSITESLNFPRESIKGHRSTISRNEENGSETDRSRKSSHSESLSLPITNIGESFDLHQSPDTNKSSIRQTSSRSFRTDSNYDTFSSHGSSDILPEKDK